MIVRLRSRAGLYVSAILLLAGISLTARATQPVTRSEMESFVYVTLAVGGGALVGAVWTLLSYHLGRLERMFSSGVERIELAQARAQAEVRAHDDDPHAHGPASEHNHGPLMEQIETIASRAERIENAVGEVLRDCEALGCRARDPRASLQPKRSGDPEGFDGRGMRGAR